jgi:hypothetical protein
VTIDRTALGEYVRFGETVPGRVQVVRLEAGSDACVDPLMMFKGEDRATVTLGFLSLLAGCAAQSEEGAALAEAVDTVRRPVTSTPPASCQASTARSVTASNCSSTVNAPPSVKPSAARLYSSCSTSRPSSIPSSRSRNSGRSPVNSTVAS